MKILGGGKNDCLSHENTWWRLIVSHDKNDCLPHMKILGGGKMIVYHMKILGGGKMIDHMKILLPPPSIFM